MSVDIFEVLEPGFLTTVQDRGRHGYQRYGVPVSGAMDLFALRAANLLVGNAEGEGALEITLLGPRLRLLENTVIAVTGADITPQLDYEELPMWQSCCVTKGSVVSFAGQRDGMRAYLAVAGGIDVPLVMGSKSTYTRASFGGLHGRALKPADVLKGVPATAGKIERRLPAELVPAYGHEHAVRVVLGPQNDFFTPEGVETLLKSPYTVTPQSDRMGYRLQGPAVKHKAGADIISDGIPFGAVQVAGDGMPIVLMADRGATGGYTKVATVISADLSQIAQAIPGDIIRFRAVTVQEAHEVLLQQEAIIQQISTVAPKHQAYAALQVLVNGEAYEITSESEEPLTRVESFIEASVTIRKSVRVTVENQTFEFDVEVQRGQ